MRRERRGLGRSRADPRAGASRRRGDGGGRRSSRLTLREALALLGACAAFVAILVSVFSSRKVPSSVQMAEPHPAADRPVPRRGAPDVSARPMLGKETIAEPASDDVFTCANPVVTDGDTLRCGDMRVRLASIDAPELAGHCRPGRRCTPGDPVVSMEHLQSLVGTAPLTCRRTDMDRYGRTVALCSAGRRDLSCAQVRSGNAVERYGVLRC